MTRTPDDIRNAIYDACDGDYTTFGDKIGTLQSELIKRLIWDECPPENGWQGAANRQIEALHNIDYTWGDTPFSLTSAPEDDPPERLRVHIYNCLYDCMPWNIDAVDDYIARHQ